MTEQEHNLIVEMIKGLKGDIKSLDSRIENLFLNGPITKLCERASTLEAQTRLIMWVGGAVALAVIAQIVERFI